MRKCVVYVFMQHRGSRAYTRKDYVFSNRKDAALFKREITKRLCKLVLDPCEALLDFMVFM